MKPLNTEDIEYVEGMISAYINTLDNEREDEFYGTEAELAQQILSHFLSWSFQHTPEYVDILKEKEVCDTKLAELKSRINGNYKWIPERGAKV